MHEQPIRVISGSIMAALVHTDCRFTCTWMVDPGWQLTLDDSAPGRAATLCCASVEGDTADGAQLEFLRQLHG